MGFDLRFTPFTAGLITLTLNAGAYMSEIFRGAINAVNPGQMEAARSLGLSHAQAMKKVVLPQALRICLPSLVNQFIITLKDSSIISVIALPEIMYQAKIYVGRTMDSFATYTWVALFYFVAITILAQIAKTVERRVSI
ncbi:MAG TPA: amino acid ABC transporter permease [Syntrophomonadaceae bacterium]|nr:amino acid ABC transporter permease [Syntrophomonadaceae bacterium]